MFQILALVYFISTVCTASIFFEDDLQRSLNLQQQEEDQSVEQKIQTLVSGWRQLSDLDRLEFFETVNNEVNIQQDLTDGFTKITGATAEDADFYTGVQLYSYYSYLYYYPIMHWKLDKTPDTNNYWVGIYKVGATDRDYLTYQWVYKETSGSYYIGLLSTDYGEESINRNDKYELRLFKNGYTRIAADSSILHGSVSNPHGVVLQKGSAPEEISTEFDPKLKIFVLALEKVLSPNAVNLAISHTYNTKERLIKLWSQFDKAEQQLLIPALEQDSLPDHIKQPDRRHDNRPEPRLLYPGQGMNQPKPNVDLARKASSNTLTITLKYSYTYVYPVIKTRNTLSGKWSWCGIYREKSATDYDYNPGSGYLEWQWVGPGYVKTTKFGSRKEYNTGELDTSYVGPIFDWDYGVGAYQQLGFAQTIIRAATYTCISCY